MKIYIDNEFNIDENAYIAKGAYLSGKIEIGADSSVWDGAVIRADIEDVKIGYGTSIQDNVTVHVDVDRPTSIGDYVTVGHNAVVHGAEIGDNTIIGMGSIVLNGAKVGKNCIIGAGAVVTEGTVIPDNSMALGIPAKVARTNTEAAIIAIRKNAESYIQLTQANVKKNQNKE